MDIRDLLSQLFASPVETLKVLLYIVWNSFKANWFGILLTTAVFLFLRWWSLRVRRENHIVRRTPNRKIERRRAKRSLMSSIVVSLLWLLYVLSMLGQLGITISPATAGILLGGLTLGFVPVVQGWVKDLVAGYHVVVEDQYGVGDYVDTGLGFAGIVTRIGQRTTRLKGADGTVHHIRHSEVPKISNRTQATGALLVDITLTPIDSHFPTDAELSGWESRIVACTSGLRAVLKDVASSGDMSSVGDAAAIVPTLVPNLSDDTLTRMRAIGDDGDAGMLREVFSKAPAGITPQFRDIELLGLVDTTTESVTTRLRVRLAEQASRSYAMSLLRRHIYVEFEPDVSAGFTDVPEGDVIN